MRALLHTCCPIQRTCSCSHYVNAGPCQIPCNCSFAYSGLIIQLNVSPLLLVICPQFDARCIPHLLLNTAHIVRFALCQMWSLSNTALLQFRRFYLKYSIECISVSIPDISTIRCALYSTIDAKCSARTLVFAMSTLISVKYNGVTVLRIQASIFI
jgi:hypothetical protein